MQCTKKWNTTSSSLFCYYKELLTLMLRKDLVNTGVSQIVHVCWCEYHTDNFSLRVSHTPNIKKFCQHFVVNTWVFMVLLVTNWRRSYLWPNCCFRYLPCNCWPSPAPQQRTNQNWTGFFWMQCACHLLSVRSYYWVTMFLYGCFLFSISGTIKGMGF